MTYIDEYYKKISVLVNGIKSAEAIVIGAGAGLSASAGLTYSGERFQKHFSDFIKRYGFSDMYSATFYPYDTHEKYWAYMSRHIFLNRYGEVGRVYSDLLKIVKNKNYFVITTNVDHCFQRSGFDKKRLFYTQGDYGLFQCSVPCHKTTYDNEITVLRMVQEQNDLKIPLSLIPNCPKCGKPMSMNLRCDYSFVQDKGWHEAQERYEMFVNKNRKAQVLYLELGVGFNTPIIIKYPFWQFTKQNSNAKYACINLGEAYSPNEIAKQTICINSDISAVISALKE